jgi:integrase
MPQRELTDRFCAHAKARSGDVQTDYFDEQTPGLALRVSRTGLKSWTYLYTAIGGKRKRMTFGTYPATSLASVRSKADTIRSAIEAGNEPKAAKDTFKSICEEYLKRDGKRLRTKAEREHLLNRLVFPAFGLRKIEDIRRSEIVRLLDRIEDNNGPVMADRTLALIRKIMNWHASRSDDFRSPIVMGMARTKPKERQRERILTDDELRAVWSQATGPFGAMVRFILLTSARRSEASEMTWAEIADSDWTLPAARNKTKVDLVRPLSKAALAVLPERLGDFVFTTDGVTSISGYSKFKRALDKTCGVTDWTLHDCRRTARSLMSRVGVASDIAERCLGHVISGVRGVYDRHEYYDEKARAFEALAAQVERIVNPPGANVVPLGRQR